LKTCLNAGHGRLGGAVTRDRADLDNLDASENNTSSYQRYRLRDWNKVRPRVTPKEIKAWLDDKQTSVNADI